MTPSRKESRGMDLKTLQKSLFQNAMDGRWEAVMEMYSADPRAREAKITRRGDTALHVAVSDCQVRVVESLVKIISSAGKQESKKVLEMMNDREVTALHIAAVIGNVKMCNAIASVEVSLVGLRNEDGETPLFLAALHGNKDAFLCLHHLSTSPTNHCRRAGDGQTILHCAILGDFYDLALHIIELYKEKLVNSMNEQGSSPLQILATKSSSFKSGTHLERWRMIVYHCILVEERKVDPKSYLRALPTKLPSQHQQLSPNNQKPYPETYATCPYFFNFLRKGIRMVCTMGRTTKKNPNDDEITDTTDAENPQHQATRHEVAIIPENYATCFHFLKFVHGAALRFMGLGLREIKKIQQKKENNVLSLQVMNELLKYTSTYEFEYDDGGKRPTSEERKEQETHPSDLDYRNITFTDDISEHLRSNRRKQLLDGDWRRKRRTQERKGGTEYDFCVDDSEESKQGRNGGTKVVIASENTFGENFLKHFPISITGRKNGKEEKMVLTAAAAAGGEGGGKTRNQNLQETAMLIAAKNGVVEMVEKILRLFPVAMGDLNADQKNVVMLAVENRQPHVYTLLLKRNIFKDSVFRAVDSEGNSALHLAAKLGDRRPWLIPGAALEMQWELKWYRFVKESMPPNFFPLYNNERKSPSDIFSETHTELIKSGERWLISTSESCSLVAALIATVAFATASTIPGGIDQNKGIPLLHGQATFNVFVITSLVALSCSVTALVMFLSILTSRFQAKDFGGSLPTKLLLGLSSLFVSIAAMLVSFCAGHYFVLSHRLQYAAFPVYAVTCLPVTLFAIAQSPLYMDLVWATVKTVPQRSYTLEL